MKISYLHQVCMFISSPQKSQNIYLWCDFAEIWSTTFSYVYQLYIIIKFRIGGPFLSLFPSPSLPPPSPSSKKQFLVMVRFHWNLNKSISITNNNRVKFRNRGRPSSPPFLSPRHSKKSNSQYLVRFWSNLNPNNFSYVYRS